MAVQAVLRMVRALEPGPTDVGVIAALQDPTLEDTVVLPTNDKEAARLVTLEPGDYTLVRGKNNTSGIARLKMYALP